MYFKFVPCLKNKTVKPIALTTYGEQVPPALPPVGLALQPCSPRVQASHVEGAQPAGFALVLERFFRASVGFQWLSPAFIWKPFGTDCVVSLSFFQNKTLLW